MSEKAAVESVRSDSAGSPEVSIVVPVFNEEGTLEHLASELLRVLSGESFEIVLVNDGSKDRTGEILVQLGAGSSGGRRGGACP